ncbi:MAG: hypothetical protein Q9217_006970 [Psora testacea]
MDPSTMSPEDLRAALSRLSLQNQEISAQNQEISAQLQKTTQKTTLEEALGICHDVYISSFRVQTNANRRAGKTTTRHDNKPCPTLLREWADFPELRHNAYQELLEVLYSHTNSSPRLFKIATALEDIRTRFSAKRIASELNLKDFRTFTVEDIVTHIFDTLAEDKDARELLRLKQHIAFDDHDNSLNDAAPQVEEREGEKAKKIWADRICYTFDGEDNEDKRQCITVIEQKPPYNFTQTMFEVGLHEMDVKKNIVDNIKIPTEAKAKVKYNAEKLIASALSQAYTYMLDAGIEFGCLETGEVTVFLKLDGLDSNTLYYHLAIPQLEVEQFLSEEDGNFPYPLTAVAQMLSFLLIALRSEVRDQNWRKSARAQAAKWTTDERDILEQLPEDERMPGTPHSSFKYRGRKLIRDSMDTARKRRNPGRSCNTNQLPEYENDNDDPDSEDDQDLSKYPTPTRLPRQSRNQKPQDGRRGRGGAPVGHQHRQYCTQACLLGLINESKLDKTCPNVKLHRRGMKKRSTHVLSRDKFCSRVQQQLAGDLVNGLTDLYLQGSRGRLFKITLLSHGYTFVAKGTRNTFIPDLRHEAIIYQHLHLLQGNLIPVYLGNIDLDYPWLDLGVQIIHMLLLSWGGKAVYEIHPHRSECARIEEAMLTLGVTHGDLFAPNVLWNEQTGGLMAVDFERSTFIRPLPAPVHALRSSSMAPTVANRTLRVKHNIELPVIAEDVKEDAEQSPAKKDATSPSRVLNEITSNTGRIKASTKIPALTEHAAEDIEHYVAETTIAG